ncbi:uncharacterized protein TNCV_1819081 [Trichonephila clavipes]|nr:uncharacterized protein TNCV_1819081 [Trichonephila clavipes]
MNKIFELDNTDYHYDDDIESFEYREVRHENSDNSMENATYNFFIQDTNANILYSNGYVQQKLRIVNDNGTAIAEDNVALVNGGGLINANRFTLGTTEIESNINYSALMLQVLGLIHFTPDYSSSEATNMFFYMDTSDNADRRPLKFHGTLTDATKITDFFKNLVTNEKYNQGFTERREFTKNSKTVTIWIPLKYVFDFFREYKKVITGMQVKFEFQRNNSKNMVYTDENKDYKVVVEDLSLWLPYVRFKNSAATKFNELRLSDKNVEINWNQHSIVKSNIFLKNSSGSYTIKATSDEVLSLYVIPQYTDRYENAKENNMLFDNLDMTECYLMINNIKVPTVSYMMDFEKEDYNRMYASLLESGLNTITSETGCMVNYSNFGKLYPIICFNLAHHQNYTDTNNLTIEFNWRLRNNPAKNYVFYFILQERKKCYLNIKNQDITMIKTLKL